MKRCPLCGEPVTAGQVASPVGMVNADRKVGGVELVHQECGLRMVLGGIGHLTNHAHWCGEMGDPDAGLSYRQSALEVWSLWMDQEAQK